MVDIDPVKLQAGGLAPTDVVNALNAQNLTLPSGLAKIGDTQYTVERCKAGGMAQTVSVVLFLEDRARLATIVGDRSRSRKHV